MENDSKFSINKDGIQSLLNSLSLVSSLFDKKDKVGEEFYLRVKNTIYYSKCVSSGMATTEYLDIPSDVAFISNCLRNLSTHVALLSSYFDEIGIQAETYVANSNTNKSDLFTTFISYLMKWQSEGFYITKDNEFLDNEQIMSLIHQNLHLKMHSIDDWNCPR